MAPLGSGICVELGAVRIYLKTVSDVQVVLEPLLQLASQKNVARILGVSTRTLNRWRHSGRLPALDGQTVAQAVENLVARSPQRKRSRAAESAGGWTKN